jgi:hypothetical protein
LKIEEVISIIRAKGAPERESESVEEVVFFCWTRSMWN